MKFEILDKLAAVAWARPAQCHLAGEAAEAFPLGWILRAASRNQEREGRRLKPRHRLGRASLVENLIDVPLDGLFTHFARQREFGDQ